jgi:hypothetical protein
MKGEPSIHPPLDEADSGLSAGEKAFLAKIYAEHAEFLEDLNDQENSIDPPPTPCPKVKGDRNHWINDRVNFLLARKYAPSIIYKAVRKETKECGRDTRQDIRHAIETGIPHIFGIIHPDDEWGEDESGGNGDGTVKARPTIKQIRKLGLYYDHNRGRYVKESNTGWIYIDKKDAENHLRSTWKVKLPAKKPDESKADHKARVTTAINNRLEKVQFYCSIEYFNSLAGYLPGYYVINGLGPALIKDGPEFIISYPGECPFIDALLDGRFGSERIWFDSLMKIAKDSLYSQVFRPLPALILIGNAETGKNLIQEEIITQILGGRAAQPFEFMVGTTNFNASMTRAEHCMIADQRTLTVKAREMVGGFIKQTAGNKEHWFHVKRQNDFIAEAFRFLSISANETMEDLRIIPDLDDESVACKLIILHALDGALPTVELREDETLRQAYQRVIEAELSAYCSKLNNLVIPGYVAGGRYGIRGYCSEYVRRLLNGVSKEMQLMQVIDQCDWLWFKPYAKAGEPEEKREWEGKSAALVTELINHHICPTFARSAEGMGRLLSSLSKKLPKRVQVREAHDHYNLFIITKPS